MSQHVILPVCSKGIRNGVRSAVPVRNGVSMARRGVGGSPTPPCGRGGEIHPVILKLGESPGVFSSASDSNKGSLQTTV